MSGNASDVRRREAAAMADAVRRYVESGGSVVCYRRSHLDGTKRLTFDVEGDRFDRQP
jgi:hypothetical protein